MTSGFARPLLAAVMISLLRLPPVVAAPDADKGKFEVRAFVNDACVIADEPYFIPVADKKDAADQAKFLPLIGLVIGKLAELFINHEIQASAQRMKTNAARKDTHYAVAKHMNLYRADFEPGPILAINAKLGCMTIVAASFTPDPVDCTVDYAPKTLTTESVHLPQNEWKTSRTDESVENQLRRANVCVAGKVRAVYEARFDFSSDGTAYRLRDAGYRVDTLLTTPDPHATRTTMYTLRISDPAATDQQEVLSSAWVNIGTVTAGAHSNGAASDAAPWLRVPTLSVDARRNYEEKTKVHQEVIGEIEALKRAQTRNQRLLAGLDQRIAAAGPDIVEGMKQERARISVQYQEQSAELEARQAEYHDLPRAPLEFMPVTIEVAVIESESENKARLALADIVGKNGGTVASAVGSAATGMLSKSVNAADIKTDADTPDSDYGRLRNAYFDALVDAQTHAAGPTRADSQHRLTAAKDRYNQARRSMGLDPIT